MNKHTELKKEEWKDIIADQRTGDRKNYVAAPSAGPGILAKYEELLDKAIGKKTEFTALVLGATPELRDMVLERGGQLTTLDISQDMIKKTTPLMKHQNHTNETIIEGSWLESGFKDNSFNIILGDGISANIAFQDQDQLFSQLKRLLNSDGFLILREVGLSKDRKQQTVEEIEQEYLDGKIHWFDVFFTLYF
ncbi:class I SAM-dependent methyltransferase [bacterium]|nr:class I SAM-dependent methyltransferase [bacterium]